MMPPGRAERYTSRPNGCGTLVIFMLLLFTPAQAQMESPLKGYGVPSVNTTEIFLSVYLDRLLSVDDKLYRHENVLYFYMSWYDPRAEPQFMKNLEDRKTKPNLKCDKYCSNTVDAYPYCCDDIYLPSFTFKNAAGFGQDRVVEYNIYVDANSNVLWETRLHGTYYQRMNFRHHPFDSFDLFIDLKYEDMAWMTEGHEGIRLKTSSFGRKLFTRAEGDDSDAWSVTDMSIGEYWYNNSALIYEESSDKPSHRRDPFPLKPAPPQAKPVAKSSAYEGIVDRRFMIFLTVERFWRPSLINCVLPVVLVAFLAMFVFFLDTKQLNDRLQIIVGLFLALTAVQFVLKDGMPTSSYIVPTQQLVLCTYVFLFVLSLESIAVYWIANWKVRYDESKRRWKSFKAARRERAEAREKARQLAAQERAKRNGGAGFGAGRRAGAGGGLLQWLCCWNSQSTSLPADSGLRVVHAPPKPPLTRIATCNAQMVRDSSGSLTSSVKLSPTSSIDGDEKLESIGGGAEKRPLVAPRLSPLPNLASRTDSAKDQEQGGARRQQVAPQAQGVESADAAQQEQAAAQAQAVEEATTALEHQTAQAQAQKPKVKEWFGFRALRIGGGMGTTMAGMPAVRSGSKGPTRTTSGRMATDDEYAAFVAHYADIAASAACTVLYIVTVIIIFTSQHGYIDLWASDQ